MAREMVTRDTGNTAMRLLETVKETIRGWTARKIVTLDVDSAGIRLLETRGRTVTRWGSVSLEPGDGGGGTASYPPALGTTVKRLMASSGIKARKVIASVTGLYSVSRILTVSKREIVGATLREAVLERAREVLPLSGDKLYLSWQPVAEEEEGRRVFVLGVRRDMMDSEVQALKAAGINPRIVELRAMALTRAVNQKRALILNIEPASFDTVVVGGGMPEIMHTAAWQPGNLTLEDKVAQLALTLGMAVDAHDFRYPDAHLDAATPLFITGQMSADLALVEKLQARLRYPVQPLAPPLKCPAHLPAAQYAVNIGLALKQAAPAVNPGAGGSSPLTLNLLPEIYRPWRPSARQVYISAALIAFIALLVPLVHVTTEAVGKTGDLQARFNILNKELERRQLEIKKRVPLQAAVDEYQTITNIGGYFTADLETVDREARKLGIQVKSITHDSKTISVTAEADSYLTFRKYLTALAESGRFATPIPPPEGYPYTKSGTIALERKKS